MSLKLDLHVHSIYSKDANLTPKTIVNLSVKKGLKGVAVTDHGTVKGGLKVKELKTTDLIAIPGVEVKTTRGDLLVLFVEEEVESGEPIEVIERVRKMGGVTVLPHPYDYMRRATMKRAEEIAKFVDVIEGFNARCLSEAMNVKALKLSKCIKKPALGGSDAHFALELGAAYTLVDDVEDEDDVKEAILKGRVKAEGKLSPSYVHLLSRLQKTLVKISLPQR